jgi:glycosyltransferase involved in cell wall biosynthesis
MLNLYIVDYHSASKDNGLNTYVNQLTKGIIRKQGIKLHYIWINSTKDTDFEKNVEGNVTHYHIQKQITFYNDDFNYELQLVDFLAQEMAGQRNVIVHFNWINHCPLAWYLKQKINCKTVLTKHSIPWRDYISSNYSLFYKLNQALANENTITLPLSLKKEQINYDSIDQIITVTQFAKQSLNRILNISEDKITIIPNGLALDEIQLANKSKLRIKYGFNPSEKILLFAGNLNQRKGVFDLVKAFSQLLNTKEIEFNNIRLVLAGPGEQYEIMKLCKRHSKKTTLTGSLNKLTLYDYYAMADIGIVPSYIEQCSYTAIEMMHAELPLIVSDVDGLKEMLPEDCGLRVKVKYTRIKATVDSNDLKNKIKYYLQNEESARAFSQNAKKYAHNNFNANEMVEQTIAVYNQLIDVPKPSSAVIPTSLSSIEESEKSLVSILLACYNGAQYLQKCLDSIFKQTFSNFELIIIDDGSTDATTAIIKKNNDPRIVYLKNSKNKGAAYSLNKAINMAKGKYIARIDQDDTMASSRLAQQVIFLNQNPTYSMVGSNCVVMTQNDFPMYRIETYQEDSDIKLGMLFKNQIVHPSIMIRKEILKKLKYNSDYKHCDDYELWLRVAANYKIYNLPEYLTFYRVHVKNTSRVHSKTQQQNTLELLSQQLDSLNIEHTVEELVIHSAVSFGHGLNYFNTKERIEKLHLWLDKIFKAQILIKQYGRSKLKEFKKHIIKDYCELY